MAYSGFKKLGGYALPTRIVHPVSLDVSGTILDTTMETLKTVSNSKLAKHYDTAPRNKDGTLFIEGDPDIFKHVLKYCVYD